MAVTGWKNPGTMATVDDAGGVLWFDPNNAKVSNNSYAIALNIPKNNHSDYLRATNFGFTTGDIPSGSAIDGIEASIERFTFPDEDGNVDRTVDLVHSAASVSDNQASADDWPWPEASEALAYYGGAADDWNYTGDDADIRSITFGFQVSVNTDSSAVFSPRVDHMRMRIYYTAPVSARRIFIS